LKLKRGRRRKRRLGLESPLDGGVDVARVAALVLIFGTLVGGVLVSTWTTFQRRHAEDDPLAS